MGLKYVELEIEDEPEYTPEQFAALPAEERLTLVKRGFSNMKKSMFLLAFGVLKFGGHDKSCTDPEVCTCSFTTVEDLAYETIKRLENEMAPQDVTVN